MNLILPGQMRDALLQYLQTKPYGEVQAIVAAFQKLSPLQQERPSLADRHTGSQPEGQ